MRWLERSLIVVGLALLGVWGSWRLDALLYRHAALHRLDEASVGSALPGDEDGGGRPLKESQPLGRIVIPRVGVSAVIAEGTSGATLRRAVGHIAGSALPGAPGNTALAGHRDGLFEPLRGIRTGDQVEVLTPRGRYTYRVDWSRVVAPTRVDLIRPTPEPALTLVTCYPFRWIGHAPKRFVVRASLVSGPRGAAPTHS